MFKLIKFIIISFFSINVMGAEFSKKNLGNSIIRGCIGSVEKPDYFYFKTANADINGDGYKDVIGLQEYGYGRLFTLWILYGFSEKFPEEFYICQAPISHTKIYGIYSYGWQFGFSTGDLNGDGFDDIVVGNLLRSYEVLETIIIYGSPNLPKEINLIDPPSSVKISSIYKIDYENSDLGLFITIGDLNMDSYDDLILSEPGFEAYNNNGKLYILYGSASGIPDIDISYPPANTTIIEGKRPEDWFGLGFNKIADCNGDKKNDLILPLWWNGFNNDREYSGLIMIIYNDLSGFPEIIDPFNPPENSTTIYGAREHDLINSAKILIEDVNNDGYEDLILGLSNALNIKERKGIVWIFYGNSSGFPKTIDLLYPPENSTYIYNSVIGSNAGSGISFGDRDGDGSKDFLIVDWFKSYGKLWLIYGPLDNLPKLIDLSNPPDNLKIVSCGEGQLEDAYLGHPAELNDINNDGTDEIIFDVSYHIEADYQIVISYFSNYKFSKKP